MSDMQDPYAYYNIHQVQNTPGAPGTNFSASGAVKIAQPMQPVPILQTEGQPTVGGVKTCRPNLYNKQQVIISQREKQGGLPAEQMPI